MYLDDLLDVAPLPPGVTPDPGIQYQVHTRPVPCTYCYAFSVSEPATESAQVRRALAAAMDRAGIVRDTFGGQGLAAPTLSPPGVWGHVDGAAQGVGHPYDRQRARELLDEAGFPNGQSLPPLDLWYDEHPTNQAIAETARAHWGAIGVDVSLNPLPPAEYARRLNQGQFQISRGTLCADYPDAYAVLHDGIETYRGSFGSWDSTALDALIAQSVDEPDPARRAELYRQIEEIFVQDDTVVLPIAYYGFQEASKPYLGRSFGPGPYDYSTWRINEIHLPLIPNGVGQ